MCAVARTTRATKEQTRLIDQPAPGWSPLCAGPFRYQTISRPFRHSDLSPSQIVDFVQGQFTNSDDFAVGVDEDSYCFELLRPGTYSLYFHPSEVRKRFEAEYSESCSQRDEFIEKIEEIWREMERRFRLAHRLGKFRVIARVGSPMTAQFTEVPADAFALYEVVDWWHGVARETGGDHIYAIHLAPRPDEKLPLPKPRESGAARQSLNSLKEVVENGGENAVTSVAPNLVSSDINSGQLAKDHESAPGSPLAYSVAEAAKNSGIGRSKIYEAIKSQELRAKKQGRRTLILAQDLAAWLNNLPSK